MSTKDLAYEALDLASEIKPLLAGRNPGVQSAALIELLAIWLAGHPPAIRAQMLRDHIKAVRAMVPIAESEMFAGGRHPQTWDG